MEFDMNKQQIDNGKLTIQSEKETEITLEQIIDHSPRLKNNTRISGVVTATLNYDATTDKYFINNPLIKGELVFVNKSTVAIDESAIGSEVLVVFEEDDIYRPVITGLIQSLKTPKQDASIKPASEKKYQSTIDDAERLVFNAEREIVLQCGKSSIHLTKAGKVIIRGSYVLSRSTGLNSLKGGAVSIN